MAFAITSFSEAPFASDSSDVIAYAQGSSLTTSSGNSTIVANANVNVTGSQATITNAGAVAGTSALVSVAGSQLTTSIGEEAINIAEDVTGQELSISNKEFTQDTLTAFSQAPFGALSPSTFEVPIVDVVTTTGAGTLPSFLLQSTLGTFSVSADGNVSVVVTEHTLNTSVGNVSITGIANVSVTGIQMAMTLGEESAFTDHTVAVTGQQLTMSMGEETSTGNANVSLTGLQLTNSIGAVTQETRYAVTGNQMATSIGSVTTTGSADIDVTGILLQSSVGNTAITAWAEVDPGVNNVWTPVDRAA